MTLTIKLEPALEKALGARSAALKQPKSVLVRDALRAYLNQSASPYELGRDLFARHDGGSALTMACWKAACTNGFGGINLQTRTYQRLPAYACQTP